MHIPFVKWHGAGNDFILIEDLQEPLSQEVIQNLCHRRCGIGADGVLLLSKGKQAPLKMQIFNADGLEVAMCGNGLRCLFRHALLSNLCQKKDWVETKNSSYLCEEQGDLIAVHMGAVKTLGWKLPLTEGEGYLVDTGVPHLVLKTQDINNLDMDSLGRKLRWDPQFSPQGTNVNFIRIQGDADLQIRTFERGVEGETLACGTGVAAAAFVGHKAFGMASKINVQTRISSFQVEVSEDNILLLGPAQKCFSGSLELSRYFTRQIQDFLTLQA